MAREAAEQLRELVAAGEEIAYDVREASDGSRLTRYEPLTARFVRDHAPELRQLDSFGIACAALEAASIAEPYLAEMGIAPPADSRRRAELAGTVFLCRLWADSTDFSLDRDRLTVALDEVEAAGAPPDEQIDVVVPLRGLVMSARRLDLPSASIVRSDSVDAPAEAAAVEGLGAAPWEPTFLAVARIDPHADGESPADVGARAVESLRGLVTTLRLFGSGGVGLGPHAWIRSSGDRWRRISTGAGRPRPGGYRLGDEELSELRAFARSLSKRWSDLGRPPSAGSFGSIGRAISRFEAGLERTVVVEGLSDHLLSLRVVLEGAGPAQLGMAMRVAALCAEPGQRESVKGVVDRALSLERELWSGEPAGDDDQPPAATALELEELARAILKDAACGHLGSDLRTTADEILLADGLAVGEGAIEQRGETAEWQPGDEEPGLAPEGELDVDLDADPGPDADWPSDDEVEQAYGPQPVWEQPTQAYSLGERFDADAEIEAEAEAEAEAEVEAGGDGGLDAAPPRPIDLFRASRERIAERAELQVPEEEDRISFQPEDARDEEDEVAQRAEAVSDWRHSRELEPAMVAESSPVFELIEQSRAERRSRDERVAELFPRPEACDWNVRELAYARRSPDDA
ncbi:MAG: hypothetical protein H0W09_03080 [Solirubrobacterales bacterium]|nr:hypothetical protein [Solirubrobacterales bacterium]